MSHDDSVAYNIGIKSKMILAERRETFSGSYAYIAHRRLNVPGQDIKQSRLSGAVCADDTIAVAWCEFYINIFKKDICLKSPD